MDGTVPRVKGSKGLVPRKSAESAVKDHLANFQSYLYPSISGVEKTPAVVADVLSLWGTAQLSTYAESHPNLCY